MKTQFQLKRPKRPLFWGLGGLEFRAPGSAPCDSFRISRLCRRRSRVYGEILQAQPLLEALWFEVTRPWVKALGFRVEGLGLRVEG